MTEYVSCVKIKKIIRDGNLEEKRLKRFIEDVKKYREYAVYSAKSGLKSEVANSHLSWLWWILDPLLFMMVYSFISVVVFGKSEKYLVAFIFIGLSSWTFFSTTIKQSVRLVTRNSSIVSKIYIPKYMLIFIQMMINAFKMSISYLLVIGTMIFYQVPVTFKIFYVIPLFLTLFFVTFGISSICMHFGVFIEDLYNVVNVFLRLVFYLSGIFYSISKRVSPPYSTILLKFNPIAYIMQSLRECMIYSTTPDGKWLLIWLFVGMILSAAGVYTIYKYENSYVKVI